MAHSDWKNLIFKLVSAGTPVVSTTTETELWRCPLSSALLTDNLLKLRVESMGRYSTTSAPTMIFGLRLVARSAAATTGTLLAKSDTIVAGSGVTTAQWRASGTVQIYAAGTVFSQGEAVVYSGQTGLTVDSGTKSAAVSPMGSAGLLVPATVTPTLTQDSDLLLTLIWGTNSASNTAAALEAAVFNCN